jgi:hypothetical protein
MHQYATSFPHFESGDKDVHSPTFDVIVLRPSPFRSVGLATIARTKGRIAAPRAQITATRTATWIADERVFPLFAGTAKGQ